MRSGQLCLLIRRLGARKKVCKFPRKSIDNRGWLDIMIVPFRSAAVIDRDRTLRVAVWCDLISNSPYGAKEGRMAVTFYECGVPSEVFLTVCYHFDGKPGSPVSSSLVAIDDRPSAFDRVTTKDTANDNSEETYVAYVWSPRVGLRHVETRQSECRGGYYSAASYALGDIMPSDEVMGAIVDWWHAQACTYELVG